MSVPRTMPTCSIGNQSLKTWNWHHCILIHSRKTLPRQNWQRTSICYLLINTLNTALQVAETNIANLECTGTPHPAPLEGSKIPPSSLQNPFQNRLQSSAFVCFFIALTASIIVI